MKTVAFTIVLNGMPYIKDVAKFVLDVFDEWYVVEGVTKPVLDTSWCTNIDKKFYTDQYTSVDGTTEFLDSITNSKLHIIRKNDFWHGKVEMCNSFMHKLENCILMQFDADEIWKPQILQDVLAYAKANDHFDGMIFKCNYYVGPNIKIVSENCYADNFYEWIRLWKIKTPTTWAAHEPPKLKGCKNYLNKTFTKQKGWIFDHYAYVQEEQLLFKENFYGYKNALNEWKNLQNSNNFPCYLRNYLSWVNDNTIVDKI